MSSEIIRYQKEISCVFLSCVESTFLKNYESRWGTIKSMIPAESGQRTREDMEGEYDQINSMQIWYFIIKHTILHN
jgi:hypothetical protein